MRKAKEYWVKNVTNSDLIISDLGLKIHVGQIANLYQLNPKLTPQKILDSEEEGAIGKCFSLRKALKLPCAPIITSDSLPAEIKEATTSLPSRAKSATIINNKELDFIEELSDNYNDGNARMYEDLEDGVFDPMIEMVPMSADGSEVGMIVTPGSDPIRESPRISDSMKMAPQQTGTGSSKYITVRTIK